MATWRTRLVNPWTLLAAFVAFGLLVVWIGGWASPGPADVTAAAPTTAEEACHLPPSSTKDGQQLESGWRLAVRLDHVDTAVLLFTSGSNELLCETTRQADGTYGGTATGLGALDSTAALLSIDTGIGPGDGDARQVLAGRLPPGAASLVVEQADGTLTQGVIGSGRYLAWIDSPDLPVRVTARDAGGGWLSELADPSGLSAGTANSPQGLTVQLTNHDAQAYLVILAVPGNGGELDAFHGWVLPAGATGRILGGNLGGELQVRQLSCDAVAAWPAADQLYAVEISGQAATLAVAPSLAPAPSLDSVEDVARCYFTGGP
jgi:hypothetical protein